MAIARFITSGKLSLSKKILLPFFLILVLLGMIATAGSLLLIRENLLDTIDHRLLAFQEVLYRDIKKQELVLGNYAGMVKFQYVAAGAQPHPELAILQDELYTSLASAKISTTFYPLAMIDNYPVESLHTLFDQSQRSGKVRFRLISDQGTTPQLTVAMPVQEQGRNTGIVLLQSPVDRGYLKQLCSPFQANVAILNLDGKVLVASNDKLSMPSPSAEEMVAIASGKKLFRTLDDFDSRQLLYAVPLGSTDIIILALDYPLTHLGTLLTSLATRSGLSILIALSIGSYLYYRLIRQIMAPLQELLRVTIAVGEGDTSQRANIADRGELGQLASSFNNMLGQVQTLYTDKIDQEREMAQAQEQLRFKEIVEAKNAEIERTNRELKIHVRELSILFQLNQVIISTLDLNVLFERTLGLLKDILGCSEIVLLFYNQGAEELEVRKFIGFDPELMKGLSFRLSEGITGAAARSKELIYVHDISKDERYINYKGKNRGYGSFVSAPIAAKNRLIGVLNLHKGRVDAFNDNELKLIQAATNQLAIAIENVQLYEKTRTLSNTDELTGLANRRYFQEILRREFAQASRYHSNFSLLMIDIDHFKHFNDTHGHLSGDVVLRRVAAALLQNTRGIDLVGRFGGEEFIVLLPKTTKEGALAAAEKLRKCIEDEPFPIVSSGQLDTRITVSIGAAEYPGDSKDIYELIDLADRALYRAKEIGRNRSVLWNGLEMRDKGLQPASPA